MPNVRELKEYEDWEKERNSTWQNFKKSLTPIHFIALCAIVLMGWYLLNQNQSQNQKTIVIVGIIVVVIVLILRGQLNKQKEPIPDDKIKIIAHQLMQRKIGNEHPFEIGTIIEPTGYCSLRFQGEWGQAFVPWKWEVGMKILYPDYKTEEVVVVLHPYEGYITRIRKVPAGYTGEESNDLKVLLPTQFAIQETKPKEQAK